MAYLSVFAVSRSCLALAAAVGLSIGILRPLDARAVAICVQAGDHAALQAALATAASDGDDDVIMLQASDYVMPSSFLLDYEPSTEHHDLTIEGGFSAAGGNPCSSRTTDARATVLHAGLLRLKMTGGATGSITLDGLTIEDAVSFDVNHPPIEIFGGADMASNVVIGNVMFVGNVSLGNAAVYAFANQGALKVHDSLFAANGSAAGMNPIRLGRFQTGGAACMEIISSTFTGNDSSVEGVDVYAQCPTIVANDIFWGNLPGGDIHFAFPQSAILGNVDLGDLTESANTSASNLVSVDPMFEADDSLHDLSPLRNLGDPGGFLFALGQHDVIGNVRTYGARPDIGAFEIQDVIFAHAFDFQPPF